MKDFAKDKVLIEIEKENEELLNRLIEEVSYDVSFNKAICTIKLTNGEVFKGGYAVFGTCSSISYFKEMAYNIAKEKAKNSILNKALKEADNNKCSIVIPMKDLLTNIPLNISEKTISSISKRNNEVFITLKECK